MNKMLMLAASLFSAGVATLVTATVVERKMVKEFDERLQRELAASVDFLVKTEKAEPTEEYQEKHKQIFGTKFDISKPPIDEVAKNQKVRYDAIVKSESYSPSKSEEEDEEDAIDKGEIYTLSMEEFMENKSEYFQQTLTYFADGGVLDSDGEFVVDWKDMIGPGVPPFGMNSGEAHIVYLRNERLRQEYEVVRDEANAADILAGPGNVT